MSVKCSCCDNKIWIEPHHNDEIIQIMVKKGTGLTALETGIEMSHASALEFAKEIMSAVGAIRKKRHDAAMKEFMERVTYLECTSKTCKGITFGKIYKVTTPDIRPSAMFGTQYLITTDNGEKGWYSSFSFKSVEKPASEASYENPVAKN